MQPIHGFEGPHEKTKGHDDTKNEGSSIWRSTPDYQDPEGSSHACSMAPSEAMKVVKGTGRRLNEAEDIHDST